MKRVTLEFEDCPPVEVTVSPVPMRAYFDFVESWTRDSTVEKFRAELAGWSKLAEPSPPIEDLDWGHARAVVNGWITAVREVPLPLPVGPSGQRPSPGPSSAIPAGHRKPRRS